MSNYKVLNSKKKEIFTDIALHPGEILQMELEARGIKKTDFATSLGMKPGHFSELLHGKRHVSAYIALKLEKMLDISAEYWMRVQVYYDLFTERLKQLNQPLNTTAPAKRLKEFAPGSQRNTRK